MGAVEAGAGTAGATCLAPWAGEGARRAGARCFCFRVFFAMNSAKRIRGPPAQLDHGASHPRRPAQTGQAAGHRMRTVTKEP
jgi:hypothetical protein